jgi:hypothetical protein
MLANEDETKFAWFSRMKSRRGSHGEILRKLVPGERKVFCPCTALDGTGILSLGVEMELR